MFIYPSFPLFLPLPLDCVSQLSPNCLIHRYKEDTETKKGRDVEMVQTTTGSTKGKSNDFMAHYNSMKQNYQVSEDS